MAMVVQEFIPSMEWAHHGRLLLVPVVFFASSVTVPYPVMLLLALVTGFLWDARHVVIVENAAAVLSSISDGKVAAGADVDLPFGYTIFLYGLLGSFMQGVRPLFRRGRWELPSVMIGVATVMLMLFEYLFINFRRGDFYFPAEFWHKVISSALLSMLAAPLVFLLLYRVAKLSGYHIRYDGLAHRR
ncbi:MAG: hypothetical protein ACC661_07775 [Verrucomicrobiales bacterium]